MPLEQNHPGTVTWTESQSRTAETLLLRCSCTGPQNSKRNKSCQIVQRRNFRPGHGAHRVSKETCGEPCFILLKQLRNSLPHGQNQSVPVGLASKLLVARRGNVTNGALPCLKSFADM